MQNVPDTEQVLKLLLASPQLDEHAWRIIDKNLKTELLKSAASLSRGRPAKR
jgi:hypothetical protein